MGEFEIVMQGKRVGIATVLKEGLYYLFSCQCVFEDSQIHSVWITWDGGCRKLGICTPGNGCFNLKTKVPIKYIPNFGLTFVIDYEEDFYSIDQDKEFYPIDKLNKARFAIRNGKPGLVIKL